MVAKRALDLVLTVLAAPLWAPLFLATAALCAAVQGRPVFFAQMRSGAGGVPFRLLKFRTMKPGNAPDGERLTRFGRFLRASSLDELPELLHVLSGKMSLVGPRPLPVRYASRYSPAQARRLEALPGITGWAQVHGRNGLPWPERFEMDVWYVDNRSLLLDLKILAMTVFTVAGARGISSSGADTMEEFKGETTA